MSVMSYDSIIETIMDSDPKTYWINSGYRFSDTNFECRFHVLDVNLRFERELNNDGSGENTNFNEDWVNKFPKREAFRLTFGLYYASTLIKSFNLVSVNGGRARLPMPKYGETASKTIVSELDYRVAQIHDVDNNMLEEYMKIVNFTISPE